MATKAVSLVSFLLFRLLLPLCLLAACIFRFNALSFLYGVFLLISPLLGKPSAQTMKGATGIYLKLLLTLSSLAVLTTILFHITLVALQSEHEPYGSMFPNCSASEEIARQVLVERLDRVPAGEVARLVAPDGVVLIAAILVLVISMALIKGEEALETEGALPTTVRSRRRRVNSIVEFFGEFFLNTMLGASGIVLPSALNGIYFLVFLVVATLWACYRNMGQRFARFRVFLLVYSGLHLLVLHVYQFQFFQNFVSHTDVVPRILGLTAIVKTDCNHPWQLILHKDVKWPYYINPGFLLLLYWILAVKTRSWATGEDAALEADGIVGTGRERRRKKKRRGDERQVAQSAKQEETGSILFSGSTYGEDDNLDEQCLVDEAEKPTYSSVEQVGSEPQPSTSREETPGTVVSIQGETDEEEVEASRRERRNLKRTPMISVFVYVMKQSYVLSLIAMMVWSITFHSWLTFVLLLGACILWMVPQSRRSCLVISPVLVFYGEALVLIQYIYGMDLTELPEKVGQIPLEEIGLMKFPTPCLQLALQTLFLLTFWLTLRQFMRERKTWGSKGPNYPLEPMEKFARKEAPLTRFFNLPLDTSDMIDGYDSNTMKAIGRCIWYILCKYWIFVCIGMQLLISLQDVVVYRIIYMILLFLFLICFQFSYTIWRLTMLVFWWVVTIYSMVVLIMIYTYQFSQFPGLWTNNTGLDNETLSDIGLEQYDTAGLFVKLLTPTSFLIIVIIQVHYFHKPFLHLSALDRHVRPDDIIDGPDNYTTDDTGATTATTDTELRIIKQSRDLKKRAVAYLRQKYRWFSVRWVPVSILLWRVAEIHMYKLVFFVIMLVSATEVSAISAVYVILLCVFLPMSKYHAVLSHIAQLWTCLVLLAKTMYQLRLVKTDYWITNCTGHIDTTMMPLMNTTNSTTPTPLSPIDRSNVTVADNARWMGLSKIYENNLDISQYLQNYLWILVVIAFERIVYYHQTQHYKNPSCPKPPRGIIFPQITREHADKGVRECIKYFFNYFFYKFGLEICYIMTAVTVCVRVDAYAVLYAIFLGVLLLLDRRKTACVWPLYTIALAVILPICFLSCLGFPLGLCIIYPWKHETEFDRNLEQWLFLPDYANPPKAIKLIADFFQLLFVCLQWRVFLVESSTGKSEYDGGSNESILEEVEAGKRIPYKDFTTTRTSFLDVIKYFVFEYVFWVTLAIVFITGTTRINLFSMGYVIAVFCFMWYGQEFLLMSLRKLLRMWNFLIGYTFFVLFAKACLQLVGCVYIKQLYQNQCWLIQLFGVFCLSAPNGLPQDATCTIQEDDTGLTWDVVCFVFLLFQRRIYSSQYFRHVVDELEAQSRLASRGAELINRIMIREVNKQKEKENEIILNIKKKMKQLKEKQAKLKKDFKEPVDHYLAIRSGDYYLFEDESEEEEAADQAATDLHGTESAEDKKLGPLQMLSTAMDLGAQAAVDRQKSMDDFHLHQTESAAVKDDATAEPKPGTSSRSQESIAEVEEEEEEEPSPEQDAPTKHPWLNFLKAFLASVTDSVVHLFNKISHNYRLVARLLNDEMKVMKQKIQSEKHSFDEIREEGDARRSSSSSHSDGSHGDQEGNLVAADASLIQITVSPPDAEQKPEECVDGQEFDETELEMTDPGDDFERSKSSRLYRLLEATYYVLISRSELLCYFLMILNQMIYCSLLSLPLPLMVFLWGMLSVPRPSKTFWITIITYTEAVVVTKYLFQFGFFPWNNKEVHESPFWPPRIMGIEQRDNYASADLALLLALFIHRSILKRYGLWKDTDDISADVARAGEKELSPPCSPVPQDHDDGNNSSMEAPELLQKSSSSLDISSDVERTRKRRSGKFKTGIKTMAQPFRNFFNEVTGFTYNATVDVYAPMFACDFITFFIVVFGYWAFGPATSSGGGDVASYISENRVPIPFLVMLIVQFVLIIIDRALFLRKNVLGKFVFQILLVFVVHIWLFFILPAVTDRSFSENVPAQIWYFTKCVYFALSAYQIRCGYPTRILGNFLTKKYNYVNLFLFKGFLAIPFLLELRALMDWIWTDTTLALSSWLQMEDIYANVFVLKCWRRSEKEYPTPRGTRRKLIVKYGLGGLLLILIIFIIWFPLVIFSIANTVFEVNPPYEATATITIGGYQPIFQVSAQQHHIRAISEGEYSSLRKYYSKRENAVGFIGNYEAKDISVITLNGKSTSLWGISPPSRRAMIAQLKSGGPIRIEFSVNFHREPDTSQPDTISNQFSLQLPKLTQLQLGELIENANSNKSVTIEKLFPRYMRLGSKGRAKPVMSLLQGPYGIGFSNATFTLFSNDTFPNLAEILEWWEVREELQGSLFSYDKSNPKLMNELTLVTFNDRKAPSGFSIITGYGIMGLYLSFILLIGRILRLTTTGQYLTIMFRELPNVDNLLQLCLNIYQVREMKEFHLEEDLYAKMIFAYRSPETMIKWARPKKDKTE